MPDGMVWESIPDALLTDCAQLVKANSIEGLFSTHAHIDGLISHNVGNKKDNMTIIYTPGDNLKVRLMFISDLQEFQIDVARKRGTWLSAKFHSTMINEYVVIDVYPPFTNKIQHR